MGSCFAQAKSPVMSAAHSVARISLRVCIVSSLVIPRNRSLRVVQGYNAGTHRVGLASLTNEGPPVKHSKQAAGRLAKPVRPNAWRRWLRK